MVAQLFPPGQRTFSAGTTLAPPDHGRQSQGLGSSSGPPFSPGDLVEDRSPSPHQHSGDQGSPPCASTLAAPPQGPSHQGAVRQRNHCRLSESPGRNPKSPGSQGGQSYPDLGRNPGVPIDSCLHPRTRQLAGRLPKSSTTRSRRVGPQPKDFPGHRCTMGSPNRGPHGLSPEPTGSPIHGQVQRPPSLSSRRSHGQLGLSPGVHLPSPPPPAQSHPENQGRVRPSDPSGPLLAQKGLVLRSGPSQQSRSLAPPPGLRPSDARPNPPPGPSLPQFDGLAIETLILQRKGFSLVIRTMMAARRPISSKTYHRVWKTFKDWCDNAGHPFRAFSLPRLLSFLQSGLSKGLSLGSLKSQISALSVLFQRRLATIPDIATFLQGVSRLHPPFRDPVPPWDLNLVLTVLQGPPFEPLGSIPLMWLTWKTVFLLAISSARRVSEISALSHLQPYLTFSLTSFSTRTEQSLEPCLPSCLRLVPPFTSTRTSPFRPSALSHPPPGKWPCTR
uniref:Core-binding (CB) domain-containing protein n=1 Tax=Xenopus tropicalis TaxID=8364 RepID=A0A803JF56_XENTR